MAAASATSLRAVERLQDDGRAAFERVFTQIVQLLAKVVARLLGVGQTGFLAVERRHHDDADRTDPARRLDDLAHRSVELRLHGRILGEDEPPETGADGRHFNIPSAEILLDFVEMPQQILAAGLETFDPKFLHIVELLG